MLKAEADVEAAVRALVVQQEAALRERDILETMRRYGEPRDPTGAKNATEIQSLRALVARLADGLPASLREATEWIDHPFFREALESTPYRIDLTVGFVRSLKVLLASLDGGATEGKG